MAQKRHYDVNWGRYREEVLDFYITKNNTVKATVKYLQEQDALHVTERQFRYEFGGYKKLSASDWKNTILPAIAKRKQDGKDSDIYLHGRRICSKRVWRAQDRYPTTVCHDFSAVENSRHQICIRTPSPRPAAPPPKKVTIDSLITKLP